MLKKLFAAVIAATMVLGLASFASAAAPSFPDTVGIPEETQIATLKALGIVTGDEQGRFNPDGTFTRAQMAVIAMKLLGQGGTAELLNQPTPFPDVQARHSWAWGYINVAVGYGIITGRPDGTFGPDDPATYTDVIVLMLRILNYEPILTVGTWPTKYLVKANEVGLTKGVSFRADAPATRRAVAVLAHNALTIPKVIQTAYGAEPKYVVSGTEDTKTQLLLDNLGTAPVEGWLVESPEIFGADKDKIQVWVDGDDDGIWDTGEEVDIPLAETADVTGLLGRTVKVWKNTDGEAFLVQDVTPASAIRAAYYDAGTIRLSSNDKEVNMTDVYCFRNYAGPDQYPSYEPLSGDEITIIYDGSVPRFALSLNYKTGVVDSASTIYDRIVFQDTAGTLSLKDWDVRFFGVAEEIGDLQKNDVVQYIDDTTNKEAVLVVTRNAPTGVFSKMDSSTYAITVGGVLYKKASGITEASTEFLGKNVKVLLNKSGRYVKVIALEDVTAPTTIAVVLDVIENVPTVDGVFDFWKLLLADGTKTTLPVDDGVTFYDEDGNDITTTYTLTEGDVIEYEVEDGYIASVTVPTPDQGPGGLTFAAQFKLVGGYLVTDSTAIFEMRDRDGDSEVLDDCRAITWAGLKELSDLQGWVDADEDNVTQAKIVVVTSATAAVTADNLYGMVTGKYEYWDAAKSQTAKAVSVLIDGQVVDYQFGSVTGAVYNYADIEEGMVVAFKISAGKADFQVLSEHNPAGTGYEWRIERVDGNLVTLQKYTEAGDKVTGTGSAKQYLIITETSDQVKSKTQFVDYTGDDPEPLIGLSVGLEVQVYSDQVLEGTTLDIAKVIVAVE